MAQKQLKYNKCSRCWEWVDPVFCSNEDFCNTESSVTPPQHIDNGWLAPSCSLEDDILESLNNTVEKLCDLVDIFSAVTTTVSGQTFIKEYDVNYEDVCVQTASGCIETKKRKIVTNPLTCETVSTTLYELDLETVFSIENSGATIVDCNSGNRGDSLISNNSFDLCIED